MLKVIDSEKEYSLWDGSLKVVDLDDPTDICQVDQREFSEFEWSVYNFLIEVGK